MSDAIDRLNEALEGRYRIERELGEGGMATVYLADDLKHERKVALKVLKPELAAVVGGERFLAEIKTTANLTHPHILPLHDSGEAGNFLFYVMPYVAGESLKDRINREKQLSVEDAVAITSRVASALAYAHEQGVIHRDVKPGNILLSEQGEPLVADFGIALAVAHAGAGRLTETGLSLGTPHYMSPEQATGDQMVGAATDVYALGCVLYQMLVGEPPYTGGTAQAVLGKIIAGKLASATEQRASVPANVDAAIRKALEKLPADRFAQAQDFARALANPAFRHGDDGSIPAHAAGGRPAWRRALGTAAGFALGIGVGLSAWAVTGRDTAPPEVIRFTIVPPDSIPLHGGGTSPDLAISRDGSLVIFQARSPSGDYLFYVRPLDEPESAPLRGTDRGAGPFFSADGQWVGFVQDGVDQLWKVSIFGGPPVVLTDVPGTLDGASWGTDDMIVFGTRTDGLFRVAGGGGEPEPLTTLDTGQGEVGHIFPHIIEGQDAVVFVIAQTGAAPLAGGQLAVLDLRSGDVKRLGLTGTSPRYVPSGHLVYAVEDGSIRAVTFDVGRREVTGSPVPLVEGIAVKNGGAANFDVSRDGRLVYSRGGIVNDQRALVWVDRSLREEPINAPLRTYIYPRISPDGGRVALDVRGDEQDLWIWDFESETPTRLILGEGAYYYYPIWSPDGERIAYSTDTGDIYWKASNNTGVPEPLAEGVGGVGEGRTPGSYFFTPDGSALVFRDQANPETNDDLAMISLDADLQDVWRLNDDYRERNAELSPNGRWMAYQSDESGQFQIYVRPFPDIDRDQTTISNNGGTHPLWSRDGRELFYLEPGAGNPRLMSVSVETDDTSGAFSFGERQLVMEWPYFPGGEGRSYDVSLDGERFLAIKPLGNDGEGASSPEITVVVGWQEVVRQRVGGN